MHLAIIHGLADVVQALIQLTPHPCLLDIQNDHFQAPLHLAVITSQPNIVRKLLFSGAEVSINFIILLRQNQKFRRFGIQTNDETQIIKYY